ncbi:MAG: adenylyltransferase/cytidyltransferase family protein, partial [Chitinophagaceae bacterium]|nr:adenylyltransferase/cytidyltransferase family protein [Chitinophagaceae bacterium]
MQVHRNIEILPEFRKAVVTIGTFDGVHAGHRKIIEQLIRDAISVGGESVIITFHPHPRKVVRDGQSPVALINTIEEKIELLETTGIDHLVIVPFTEAFSQLTARQYVEQFLIGRFHPHIVIIGYDHHFGQGREGNFRLLEEYRDNGAFILREIPEHLLRENIVSSTAIRTALQEGKTEEANELLGYTFFFDGRVVEGRKLGRTLGYPTANLTI